jgi:hypothetical protein
MSFLYRTTPVLRTTIASQSTRCLSTSLARQNVVKDTAQKVDRTVSDQLVKGIDKGGMLSFRVLPPNPLLQLLTYNHS